MNNNSETDKHLQRAEKDCYATSTVENDSEKLLCELVFDGIMCWLSTPAGLLAHQPCSNKYINFSQNGSATKQCDSTGKWYVPENSTKPWTNYTACGRFLSTNVLIEDTTDHDIYNEWLPIIKSVTQFGYVLSTISLIIALFVFIHIKRLHCARNKLHVHLFISFVLRALMHLLKDLLFVKGVALPQDIIYIDGKPQFDKDSTSWVCKAMTSSRNYFIITNYMFLLMEGAYLHNLLFMKHFYEDGIAIYYTLGWSLPITFIIPWIILKANGDNLYCWTLKSNKYIALLIDIPIGLTVLINFVLFTIIMRILFVKLSSMYMQQKRIKYQKLARATAILVPLFGIPYTISFALSFYVSKNQTCEILWLFFDQVFAAFQGLFASLAYCFLNSEVQIEIARKYNSFKDRNNREFKKRTRTISHTQQIPLNEDPQEFPHNNHVDHLIVNKTSDYF